MQNAVYKKALEEYETLNTLVLPSLVLAKAKHLIIKCPGNNTLEMSWCASKKFDESNAVLAKEKKLSPETLR